MERILVVEHERLFGEGLALLLEWRTGLGCVYAGSLAEAKGLLEEATRKPACIIVDLDLPDGEANDLLEQLDGVPVVGLIRGRNVQRQAEALQLGAEEVLVTAGRSKRKSPRWNGSSAPDPSPPSRPYSSEWVEGLFSEVQMQHPA